MVDLWVRAMFNWWVGCLKNHAWGECLMQGGSHQLVANGVRCKVITARIISVKPTSMMWGWHRWYDAIVFWMLLGKLCHQQKVCRAPVSCVIGNTKVWWFSCKLRPRDTMCRGNVCSGVSCVHVILHVWSRSCVSCVHKKLNSRVSCVHRDNMVL